MKEIVIVLLSISFMSALASTANAMRSRLTTSGNIDAQTSALIETDSQNVPAPIVYDQPPEDEEHWPGSRD